MNGCRREDPTMATAIRPAFERSTRPSLLRRRVAMLLVTAGLCSPLSSGADVSGAERVQQADQSGLAAIEALIQPALESADPALQLSLGRLLLDGVPVSDSNPIRVPRPREARQLLKLAAESPVTFTGLYKARVAYAKLLGKSDIQADKLESTRLLLAAARAGDMDAQFELARSGAATGGRTPEEWLSVAVQSGSTDAVLLQAERLLEPNRERSLRSAQYARLILSERAAAGSTDAMRKLGELLSDGKLLAPVPSQARRWYEKAASHGDRKSMLALARAFDDGGWLIPDGALATRLYLEAATAGSLAASKALARAVTGPGSLTIGAADALIWLRRVAEAGSTSGMVDLAGHLASAAGMDGDSVKEARQWLQRAEDAAGDEPKSLLKIARIYRDYFHDGGGTEKSLSLLEGAAAAGSVRAMVELGRLIARGELSNTPADTAVRWLRQAASTGNAEALVSLADAYLEGDGVDPDRNQALALYREAAQGAQSVRAMMRLAREYRTDRTNEAGAASERLTWLRRAASAGNNTAKIELGLAHARGEGTSPDVAQAAWWLEQAAATGSAKAMGMLGDLHSGDYGPPVDLGQARNWYGQAWQRGVQSAGLRLGRLLLKAGEADSALSLLTTLAEDGSYRASIELSVLYSRGEFVPRNLDLSNQWLNRAEAVGERNPAALAELGEAILTTSADQRSLSRAIELLNAAAAGGNAQALRTLANAYRTGTAVSPDPARAVRYSEQAVARGAIGEVVPLARAYALGHAGPPAPERALALLEEAASNKPVNRQVARELAHFYRKGIGTKPDLSAASSWLTEAAQAGSVAAQLELANNLATGNGMAIDARASAYWLRKAAESGSTRALLALARALASGFGVPIDQERAFYYFSQAARLGSLTGLREVARAYVAGFGVEQDHPRAVELFERAAARGDRTAMMDLYRTHTLGRSQVTNLVRGAYWLDKAAQQGHKDAMYRLGLAYLGGLGVEADKGQARSWLGQAVAAGHRQAAVALAALDNSPGQSR